MILPSVYLREPVVMLRASNHEEAVKACDALFAAVYAVADERKEQMIAFDVDKWSNGDDAPILRAIDRRD